MSHGSKLIQSLESAWADIRAAYPDVPDAVIITGTAVKGKRIVRGHFAAGRWERDGALPEVFLAGELFKPPGLKPSTAGGVEPERVPSFGQRVMQTLIHEAAHGRAHAAGKKDTSRGGRYHNKVFLSLAVEMGLTKPEQPDPSIGWSDCPLAELGQWERTVARLNGAEVPHRTPDARMLAPTTARSGARSSCECACDPPRKLSITPKQMEAGAILCGVCGESFQEA